MVTDLKQWAYCRRIAFYRHVMPGIGKATYKMEEGKRAQEMIESLEVRRSIAKYGLGEAQRRFGVWLSDERSGLSGKIDLLLEAEAEAGVVDFKLTSGDPGENHRLQLAGYAALVHGATGRMVRHGFVCRIPDSRVFEIAIDEAAIERVRRAVAEIRECWDKELLPEPTRVAARCTECEYQNYCGDIW